MQHLCTHIYSVIYILRNLNSDYGKCVAHNGLWEMAVKTQHNIVERMALVPRVLEARGLDVTPGMIKRLLAVGRNEEPGSTYQGYRITETEHS